MLLLLFEAGQQRYAIDTRQVIEIVPWVQLYPAPPSHRAIVGLLNYHCHLTTIIDLGRLLQLIPSKPNFGSRIMLLPRIIGDNAPNKANQYIGLLADRVLETRQVKADQLVPLDGAQHNAIEAIDLIHLSPITQALLDPQEIIYYLQPNFAPAPPTAPIDAAILH